MLRPRSLRRVKVKTPKGIKIVYKKKKPKNARCAICKKPLAGVLRLRPAKLRNVAKTKKRPERAYGGVLCSKCSREMLIKKARS